MGRVRNRFSVIVGDVCAVAVVLSGGSCAIGFLVSLLLFDDIKLQAFITLSAMVLVVAALVYHVVEGS